MLEPLSNMPDWAQMVSPGRPTDPTPEVQAVRNMVQGNRALQLSLEQLLKRRALQYAAEGAASQSDRERAEQAAGYSAIMELMSTLFTTPDRTPRQQETY